MGKKNFFIWKEDKVAFKMLALRCSRTFTKARYISTVMDKSVELTSDEVAPHVPVLLEESIQYLKPKDGETILDMTFGAGGHSKKILEKYSNIRLLCLDRDLTAFNYAEKLSRQYKSVVPLLGKFSDLPKLLTSYDIKQNSIDGILFDFGCSSMQLDLAGRGFSLSKNGPLDMRMDGNREPGMC